ncbi:EAL domain-containing protein [Pantoea sp. ACRSB]|uniref:EAL domain-containing protein n=1 Tax=Pantoea sp. ACRSB TaxID=2918207 RepID=UPI002892C1FB|nr:EAL domain-containing protein [Pantoea sp. ACRSB]MCG7387297.1 EAL domain-containing protein [Pantoea sp. ACRSB]
MEHSFWAQPIHTTDGKLLGVEVLTKFEQPGLYQVINPKYYIKSLSVEAKRQLLIDQLLTIEEYSHWFRHNNQYCTVNIDFDLADLLLNDPWLKNIVMQLPFVRLEISEDFEGLNDGMNNSVIRSLVENLNILWLDDLGAGRANMQAVTTQVYEVVKLDRKFYRQEIEKPTFCTLIDNIKKYCDRVVVEGVEFIEELPILRESGIWGVQGYLFKSVPLNRVQTLL